MQYRNLGKTDIEVSTVAFGAWGIVGGFNWGPQDEQDSIAALRAAFDAGVTMYDTAEPYGEGRSEQLIHRALGDVRDDLVIASKVAASHLAPDQVRLACERSLRALRTDRIDLYQVHWPSRETRFDETFSALAQLQQQGKIRAYGVSNFGCQDLGAALDIDRAICSNQLAYNLLFRAVEHEIQPLCVQEQVLILCYSALMQGLLTGKFAHAGEVPDDRARTRHFPCSRPQARHNEDGAEALTFEAVARIERIAKDLGAPMGDVAVAWLLAQPGVATAIVGARNADQARGNARAADLVLDLDTVRQLAEATNALKEHLGANADMWQSESRIR